MRRWPALLIVLPALLHAQQDKILVNEGVQAYRNGQYQDAIADFQQAAALSPNDPVNHLYLGSSYLALWIPGATAPENTQNARAAEAEFRRVLELDPRNIPALSTLAMQSFREGKLDQTRDLFQQLLQIDPANRDAFYTLGVVAWKQVQAPLMEARTQLGMRPETPGPLPDITTRQRLQTAYGFVIDDGMKNLEAALRIDPQYDDAMAYMNLLLRQRADLRDTPADAAGDIASADQWLPQALNAKKAKAGAPGQFAPPPPPPPPPPQASATPSSQPRRIAGVFQQVLIRRVEPVYPPLAMAARIQGSVQFQAIIGKDGTVSSLQLISGHPLLVPAARDAVQQWIYKPTFLNNEPVEVITDITVNFTLPAN